jgi:hypothetical protein
METDTKHLVEYKHGQLLLSKNIKMSTQKDREYTLLKQDWVRREWHDQLEIVYRYRVCCHHCRTRNEVAALEFLMQLLLDDGECTRMEQVNIA